MHVDANSIAALKTWLIKKLDNISDADSDVLADYVIALIKSDEPEGQLRSSCVENLEDFLKDHSQSFVDEVLKAIKTKSYIPGYKPQQPARPQKSSSTPSATPVHDFNFSQSAGISEPQAKPIRSRKRGYVDRDAPNGGEQPTGGRAKKIQRRGGSPVVVGRGTSVRGSRRGGVNAAVPPQFPSYGSTLPPFDPSNPMSIMMAMHAMGLPLPGWFGQTQAGDFGSWAEDKSGLRCPDYDKKGFCATGAKCPFEHGTDALIMTNDANEYDPRRPLDGFPSHAQQESRPKARGRQQSKASSRLPRGGFQSSDLNSNENGTTVLVKRIPPEHLTEGAVRAFFSQFGPIATVTLQPSRQIAILEYTNHSSARAAYESPAAIFGNRFVEVRWKRPFPKPVVTAPQKDPDVVSPDDPEFIQRQAAAQQAFEERQKLLEERRKQSQELDRMLEHIMAEKRKVMQRLAEMTGEPLETFHGTEGDSDSRTATLRAQLAALEQVAENMGLPLDFDNDHAVATNGSPHLAYSGRGRGRGSYYRGRGSGRATYSNTRGGVARLDNRPKAICISAVLETNSNNMEVNASRLDFGKEKYAEALRTALFQFHDHVADICFKQRAPDSGGESGDDADDEEEADETLDNRGPKDSAIVTFRERYAAEMFIESVIGGGSNMIPGLGLVKLEWTQTPKSNGVSAIATPAEMPEPQMDEVRIGDAESEYSEEGQVGDDEGSDHEHRRVRAEFEHDYDVAE